MVTSKRAITRASSSRSKRYELHEADSNAPDESKAASESKHETSSMAYVDSQRNTLADLTCHRDDALQTKTNDVTDALRRTATMMQSELERSVLSVQMLGAYSISHRADLRRVYENSAHHVQPV